MFRTFRIFSFSSVIYERDHLFKAKPIILDKYFKNSFLILIIIATTLQEHFTVAVKAVTNIKTNNRLEIFSLYVRACFEFKYEKKWTFP